MRGAEAVAALSLTMPAERLTERRQSDWPPDPYPASPTAARRTLGLATERLSGVRALRCRSFEW